MNENVSMSPEDQENTEINNETLDSQENHENGNNRNKASKDEVTAENCRFTEGDILKFIRVRFPGHAKSYPFLMGKRKLMYGQKVVAMSDRGMAVGYINSFPYELQFKKDMLPLRSINKIATQQDIEQEHDTYKRQKEIETTCQNLIEKHNLDMNLTHVEFTQFGKKVVFYFVAPARVDFRGLVKDLVTDLKLRIELRQISVRDRAASMGALGPCGRELCCSSFLSRYGNVSIKMAKNQNLTLNYSMLNGVCGQLKCCLQYEDEVYEHKRKKLPTEGTIIKTLNGDIGKVRKLHLLPEQFDLLTSTGHIKRYTIDQFDRYLKNYNMKDRFDHISDETATVIGLTDLEAKKSQEFQTQLSKITKRSVEYANEVYKELTGISQEEMKASTQDRMDVIAKEMGDDNYFNKAQETKKNEQLDSRVNKNTSRKIDFSEKMSPQEKQDLELSSVNNEADDKREKNDVENKEAQKRRPSRRRNNRRRGHHKDRPNNK